MIIKVIATNFYPWDECLLISNYKTKIYENNAAIDNFCVNPNRNKKKNN